MFKDPTQKQVEESNLPPKDEELEQTVEECIKEFVDEDINKDFEEFKNMENKQTGLSNEHIDEKLTKMTMLIIQNNKDILENKKEIITASKEDYNLSIHAITELHYLKKHFGKISVLVVLLVFVCGTGFGTLYESWLPYVDTLIDFFKITNQVSKGV